MAVNPKRHIRREFEFCKHYTGTQYPACEAGVNYHAQFLDKGIKFPQWPCISDHEEPVACPADAVLFPMPEEVAERKQRQAEFINRMAEDMEAGRCTVCHQPATRKQVGPCVYGDPCGHCMYQGKA